MAFFKKIVTNILHSITMCFVYLRYLTSKSRRMSVGLILEEFFHKDLRGFGGYAMTAKNISDYYNNHQDLNLRINILLASKLPIAPKPCIKKFHNAKVLFRPFDDESPNIDLIRYLWCFVINPSHVLLCIEYYLTYSYILKALPWIPVIIYIRDPRGPQEWERLGGISTELQWRKIDSPSSLIQRMDLENNSVREIIKFSKTHNRKIIFATNADFLVQRAKKAYNLPEMKPYFLPNPLSMPKLDNVVCSNRPSIVFIGRLDPQKRIWMIFELAKMFQNVDFIIGGSTSSSEGNVLAPIIDQYKHLNNLKFLGTIDGEPKWKVMAESWGMINTSIHEGLPVTFLESLSFAKPVISCLNPDELVTRFGYYTGDILGEGTDKESLNKFSKQIELFLTDPQQRQEKGRQGRAYVEKRHSFENFNKHLNEILKNENIL
ncbi:MAG: glycosyltransferase [Candidatus Omnitrophica bacterium]|nr:glycosyltransferase [Candidatus Omnitrophota bacterium]